MPPIPSTMRAAVLATPGGPEALQIKSLPIPTPSASQVLLRIHAAGLNRSELFTRRGDSGPAVPLPRVLGIECVGTIAAIGTGSTANLKQGDIVATCMGGLGRTFDGGYAEFACVSAANVVKLPDNVDKELGWDVLGALPEMIQTAYGSLKKSLRLAEEETLLIRGGTTSVGLAAASLAKWMGAKQVIGTSRSKSREGLMLDAGIDHVVIDSGKVEEEVRKLAPEGVDKVLELVGVTTLQDSLNCVKEGGIVCMTGIVGDKWALDGFNPMEFIPSAVCLTAYSGGPEDFKQTPYGEIIPLLTQGKLKVQVGKTFPLTSVVEAHTLMEENRIGGKAVLLME